MKGLRAARVTLASEQNAALNREVYSMTRDTKASTSRAVTSIIIPTCRRAECLCFLLESLASHGYINRDDIEVIVVNNEQEPVQPKEPWTQIDNLVYLHQPVRGRSAALNLGISAAVGDFIMCLDDDTVVTDPSWLDMMLQCFEENPAIGYVGGRILGWQPAAPAQKMWEDKGALSKGEYPISADQEWFRRSRLVGVPVRLVAVGANCVMPRSVLRIIGGFDERFGPGSLIPHGESLDMCYRILRAGYTVYYEPNACISHVHPASMGALRRKMFIYGIGDTAVHTKFFVEYGDVRSLFEILWGRAFLLVKRLLLSLFGHYPLSADLVCLSLLGTWVGPLFYLWSRIAEGSVEDRDACVNI